MVRAIDEITIGRRFAPRDDDAMSRHSGSGRCPISATPAAADFRTTSKP